MLFNILEKKAVVNIDRENCLAPCYLNQKPQADVFEACQTFKAIGTFGLLYRVAIDNVGTFLQGFRDGYLQYRQNFMDHRGAAEVQIRALAGKQADNVIRRLTLSDEDMDELLRSLMSGINEAFQEWEGPRVSIQAKSLDELLMDQTMTLSQI